jgi:diguanylate cyclase (GGDEF)-like protein/PAS domain S-box-containing protein
MNDAINFKEAPGHDWRDSEITELRARCSEAEETLLALKTGAADALLGDTGILYLSGAEKTYITFFSVMNEGGVTLDSAGKILYCNPRFVAMMEQPVEALRGRSLLSCVIEAERARVVAFLAKEGPGSCEVTLAVQRTDGLPVQLSLTHLEAGQHSLICLLVTDLTKRMEVERELERLVEERTGELRLAASVFENTLEGVMVTDQNNVILSVNPAFTEITGYSAAEAIGNTPSMLRSQRHDPAFYQQLWKALRADGRWRGEIWNRRKSGEAYLQRSTINLVPAQRGQPACYVAVFTDATERWQHDERLAHLAYHDPLTDLPNRTLLLDRLTHALTVAAREGEMLGVLFIDLDGFKTVNDTLGHYAGDQMLQKIASRLIASVRSCDTVARIGGDEFVVLMENFDNAEECAVLAEKLLSDLSCEAAAGNRKVGVSASVGIAVYPANGEDAVTLLQHADAALYEAKMAGKHTFRYFNGAD